MAGGYSQTGRLQKVCRLATELIPFNLALALYVARTSINTSLIRSILNFRLLLESGVQRSRAHKFYFNCGLSISCYRFEKDL